MRGPRLPLLLGSTALFFACGAREPLPPSILVVTLDTTRADALSCYGGPDGASPNLDRLAAEGVVFERAVTTVPITLPAHASMFTGLVPPRHGIRDNGAAPLSPAALTSAEVARTRGYDTAAFVSAVVLDGRFGLDQGFDHYDEPGNLDVEEGRNKVTERPADRMVDAALAWLEERPGDKPFFLWLHLYDPHGPYEPPARFRTGTTEEELYQDEIRAMDHELGRLFDALRAEDSDLERTAVLVVSDHGEAFGEHGEIGHGVFCYQPTLHVPLFLRPPGGTIEQRNTSLRSVVDVHPTLLQWMGATPAADLDGHSLLLPTPADRGAYFESYYSYLAFRWSPLAGWMNHEGKYIHSATPELFDLGVDPGEETNLLERGPDGGLPFRDHLGRTLSLSPLPRGEATADPDLDAQLAALGYASAGSEGADLPHPLAPTDLPSPKSRTAAMIRIEEASRAAAEGDLDAAEATYLELLAENPVNGFVLEKLATLQMQRNDAPAAIETLQRLLSTGRKKAPSYYKLGVCLRAVRRTDEAIEALTEALARSGGNARFRATLVETLRAAGRDAEAQAISAGSRD